MRLTFDQWFKENKNICIKDFAEWIVKYQFGDVDLDTFTHYQYFMYLYGKKIRKDFLSWEDNDGKKISEKFKNAEEFSWFLFNSADNNNDISSFDNPGLA